MYIMKEISKNSFLSFTLLLFNVYWHFRNANVVSGCLWIRFGFDTGHILIKSVQLLLRVFIGRMTWLEMNGYGSIHTEINYCLTKLFGKWISILLI